MKLGMSGLYGELSSHLGKSWRHAMRQARRLTIIIGRNQRELFNGVCDLLTIEMAAYTSAIRIHIEDKTAHAPMAELLRSVLHATIPIAWQMPQIVRLYAECRREGIRNITIQATNNVCRTKAPKPSTSRHQAPLITVLHNPDDCQFLTHSRSGNHTVPIVLIHCEVFALVSNEDFNLQSLLASNNGTIPVIVGNCSFSTFQVREVMPESNLAELCLEIQECRA